MDKLLLMKLRVLVVDDYAPFRTWVCSFLREKLDLQAVCECADGLEAVEKAEELRPDLILLDIGLPKLNGIEATRQILRVIPDSRVIFLTQETCADIVKMALESGGLGYVTKATATTDLPKAIDSVLQGQPFVSSACQA